MREGVTVMVKEHKGMSRALAVRILVILVCLAVSQPSLWSQIRSGAISGSVVDPSGAIVAGAAVTVTETSTNVRYDIKTNQSGEFQAPYLPPGVYRVEVTQPGFQKSMRDAISLGALQTIRVEMRLKVAQATESVVVSAESSSVQVDSATVESTVSRSLIEAIPNVSHNPLAYVALQAGITTRASQSNASNQNSFAVGINGRRQISNFAVNGGEGFQNDIQLDGLSVLGSGWNEVSVVPNQDGVQEVRTSVNNYSAEYGRGQGVVSITTKGGSNEFHGSGFLRNRSGFMNANTFDNNVHDVERPDSKVFTFGGSGGGPIKKDRAFFFASYEGLYFNNPVTFLRTVPTEAERIGDFSQSVVNVGGVATPLTLYDPWSATETAPNVYTRTPIPGAIITNANAAALKVLSNYGMPNRTPDDAFHLNNFMRTADQAIRRNNINSRVDYRLGERNFLYFSGGYTRGNITNPLTWADDNYWNSMAGEQYARFIQDRNPYAAIGDTFTITPTLILDLRYGVNRINARSSSDEFDDFDYTSVGIPKDVQDALQVRAVPNFNVTGGGNWSNVNNNGSTHKRERQTNHVFAGSMTKNVGRWNLKWGGELRALLANYRDPGEAVAYDINSSFTVPTVNASGTQVGTTTAANGGQAYASFLLGTGNLRMTQGQSVLIAMLSQYGALYTQNDWHPTSKLTINLGLRWDWQPAPTERYNRISSFDFVGTNPYGGQGSLYFPGVTGESRRLWKTDWSMWQPRFGIAYRYNDATVFRGGFGITSIPSNSGFFGGPFNYGSQSFSPYTDSLPYGTDPHGVPVGTFDQVNTVVQPSNADATTPRLYGSQGPHFPYADFKTPHIYQANLHIQRDLGHHWVGDIGYNGTIGKRLSQARIPLNSDQYLPASTLAAWREDYIARNGKGNAGSDQVVNPFQPTTGSLIKFLGNLGSATMPLNQTLWPYPYYGSSMTIQQRNGYSSYHSLQVSARREMSDGLMMSISYTWSRSMGYTNGEGQNNFGVEGLGTVSSNLLDYSQNKHLTANDAPHRVVVSAVYDLPFSKGKALAPANKVVSALASGWQVSGTYVYQSGVPLTVTGASNGSMNSRPNAVSGASLELPKSLQGWYDGKTSITLPSGRVIKPAANTYLKYNPDAFTGGLVTVANGTTQTDLNWWGDAAITYNGLRADPVNNVSMALRRSFRIAERYAVDLQANATNLFNHTQFSPTSWSMALGNTSITSNLNSGLAQGYGQAATYGAHGTATLDPRLMELQIKFRF